MTANGREQVTRDSGVDTDVDSLVLRLGGELCTSTREAKECPRIDHAEDCDSREDFILSERSGVAERGASDGLEDIHRDTVALQALDVEGQLDTLLQCLTHADNTATADTHTYTASGLESRFFVLLRVCRTQLTEVAGRSLHIAMVGRHAAIKEFLQLWLGE